MENGHLEPDDIVIAHSTRDSTRDGLGGSIEEYREPNSPDAVDTLGRGSADGARR
jgi:hypothetical protein